MANHECGSKGVGLCALQYVHMRIREENPRICLKKMKNVLIPSGCRIDEQVGYYDPSIVESRKVRSQDDCAQLSLATHGSYFWSYVPVLGDCYVKATNLDPRPNAYAVSGNRECGRN